MVTDPEHRHPQLTLSTLLDLVLVAERQPHLSVAVNRSERALLAVQGVLVTMTLLSSFDLISQKLTATHSNKSRKPLP